MSGTVTTSGHASVPARPDRAVLTLTLSALKPAADAALTDVAGRSQTLTGLLGGLGITDKDWATSGLSVGEELEWVRDRNVSKGFRASTQVRVTIADVAVLGKLLQSVVKDVAADVAGPTWVVDQDNPARVESYRLAALDARRRAAAYADALGHRLGTVITVDETGGASVGPPPRPMMRAMAMSAGPAPEMDVSGGEIDVSASVVVTFGLS